MRPVRLRAIGSASLSVLVSFASLALVCQRTVAEPEPPLDLVARLRSDVSSLAETVGERNPRRPVALAAAADFIRQRLRKQGLAPRRLAYEIPAPDGPGRLRVENIEVVLPGRRADIIVVGAHYDSAEGTPGADDNASACAVLLELAERLRKRSLEHTVHLAWFTLEEPPYFRTADMGSVRYVQALRSRRTTVRLMVALDSVGYFLGAQRYPHPLLYLKYPWRGNFIGVIGITPYARETRRFYRAFQEDLGLRSEVMIAPRELEGVDFSDHLAFWDAGMPALLVTDTALFRNPNYHRAGDRPSTLDYPKLGHLVRGLERALVRFDRSPIAAD